MSFPWRLDRISSFTAVLRVSQFSHLISACQLWYCLTFCFGINVASLYISFNQGKQIFLTYEGVNVVLSYMKVVQKVRNLEFTVYLRFYGFKNFSRIFIFFYFSRCGDNLMISSVVYKERKCTYCCTYLLYLFKVLGGGGGESKFYSCPLIFVQNGCHGWLLTIISWVPLVSRV